MANLPDARAWVEVDLDALRANYATLRERAGAATAIVPMVKADGYGVGLERVARALEPLAPWGFGVATAEEGARLRAAGLRLPVIVFSPLSAEAVDTAGEAGLTASISDLDGLDQWRTAAARLRRRLDFHVEIDTGMGRCGFDWRQTPSWGEAVRARMHGLRWAGAFTHFQGADAADRTPTGTQWQRFGDALLQLPVSREELMKHACNSAAVLRWPEYAADAVRPGIFLYGGQPAPGVADVPAPVPVVSVRARVVLVRDVPPGSTVGYGATHAAREWERWGTVTIGYGDGLSRKLCNRGSALVRGRRVPIIGRISMDMIVVDLSAIPDAAAGDVATLLGQDGDARITVEEVAAQAETISYEVLTGLTPRLPRVERGAGARR